MLFLNCDCKTNRYNINSKMYSKLLIHILLINLLFLSKSFAQGPFVQLHTADSLFESKKYIESFEIYRQITDSSSQFSPRMLLRMAFIKEGLGDYTSALYYLNLFYSYNPDKEVLKKMEELALKYKLTGYTYTDRDYFISLYYEYYYFILFFFLIAAVSYYIYMVVNRRIGLGLKPFYFIIILVAAFYLSNYSLTRPKGIIVNSGVHLMSSPSAGAALIEVVNKGHRVIILKKEDIWYEILWDGAPAYIRENNIVKVDR
jgi:hypothetical protein